jgi:general secretion pathway protein A
MYAAFYNLKKEAFHITPDPEFLFLSPSHKEALGSIIYGVQQRKGFVSITGEVGVGKTTVIRSYLEQADSRKLKIIYIFNANVLFTGLLKTIYQELGINAGSGDDYELVNGLHEVLIEEYKKGFNVVLIIDEAQNMPVRTLENLRMLSNLETSTAKLIQIVFSGQPEFERMLDMKELRQLRQRIAVKATIMPLTAEESLAYIRHRLAKVSAGNTSIFTDGALKRIAREARGIPRVINILCENAFITALGYRKKQINTQIVREVITDFAGGKKKPGSRIAFVSIATAVFLLCVLLVYFNRDAMVAMPAKGQPATPVVGNNAVTLRVAGDVAGNPGKQLPQTSKDQVAYGSVKEKRNAMDEDLPVVKTVRKGDTLSVLVEDVYGHSSMGLILRVKNRNTAISDVNRISVGQKIVFPAREKRSGKTNE